MFCTFRMMMTLKMTEHLRARIELYKAIRIKYRENKSTLFVIVVKILLTDAVCSVRDSIH